MNKQDIIYKLMEIHADFETLEDRIELAFNISPAALREFERMQDQISSVIGHIVTAKEKEKSRKPDIIRQHLNNRIILDRWNEEKGEYERLTLPPDAELFL